MAYHRWLNILNTLIDNRIKVKEILKKGRLWWYENPYLFGEKLQEKLIKKTSAKLRPNYN